ncbi:beta-phosphoglucomutase [Hungatella effluvii]|uniref:Beta-phosphoglucomutase n=1 Tax=Hungatella effluvii TaxID=1096246 RepID=A0A2V3Y0R5_9FIRM|nr:beta-phosphoglucomutase [Hungatella effluvii]PXX50738.1 beta-phosphoglucomutase [Hungatella effluvii]
MKKYMGIIFDLDGVLCITDRYHYQAWKRIADTLKIEFNEAKNHRLRGVSRMESLDIILENYDKPLSVEEKIALAEEKNRYYREFLETMSESDIEDAVFATLDELRVRRYLLAIGSSSKNAGFILEKTGLIKYFDAISDGNGLNKSKPDPEVFLRAADDLRLAPEKCLVVEDAAAGIMAALAGGFDSAGIGDGTAVPGVTYRLERFEELLEVV